MTRYICVCESKASGHRTGAEPIHILPVNGDETPCGLKREDSMPVRTLAGFTGASPFCDDCADAVPSVCPQNGGYIE